MALLWNPAKDLLLAYFLHLFESLLFFWKDSGIVDFMLLQIKTIIAGSLLYPHCE
jgi:hypothetical protein